MSLNISLKQLVIFTKVVYYGGISEAAKKLHLSPSAVSKGLNCLENSLGVCLIQRTTRDIRITKAGEVLYQKADKILDELESTLDAIAEQNDEPQGELRITCSLALGTAHLMNIIAEYRKRYPKVNLLVDLSDKLVNLNEGEFDLALRIVNKAPDNYAIKKLTPINWVYCASPDYLKKVGVPDSIQALSKYDCLVYPSIDSAWYYRDERGEKKPIEFENVPIQANSSLALLEAALHAQGIAYLPTYLLHKHMQSGELVPLFRPHLLNEEHYLYALYVPNRHMNYNIRTFVDFIYDRIGPVAPWDNWFERNKAEES